MHQHTTSYKTEQLDFDISAKTNTINDTSRLTLTYTEEPFMEQLFASDYISVNPYNIITYVGDVAIDPPSDSWEEVKILPEVVNTVNVTNHKTRVIQAVKASTINNVKNIIKSVASPSDAQKQYLAQGQRNGLAAYVYNPKTETVTGSDGKVFTGVNEQVVNNFLNRK